MNKTEFHSKAELYHRFRWDYNPKAIDFIIKKANLNKSSVLLDIGAGTGILTKHFVNRVGTMYAAEPDSNMFSFLKGNIKNIIPIRRYSNSLPEIQDKTVNAIVTAHAIHWFDYNATIKEFNRIAIDNCMIFSIENRNISENLLFSESGSVINKYKNDAIKNKINKNHFNLYFAEQKVHETHFQFTMKTDLESFIGSLSSISFVPSPCSSIFQDFQNEAEDLFLKYAEKNDSIETDVDTIVRFGLLSMY
jgi:ubiquinone/menaquinone biosynthesis C-methylase UbiE